MPRARVLPRSIALWRSVCAGPIAPPRQGRGYAREALTCLLEHMFRARGTHRAVANIDPRNAPSIALFERLGFTREGHLRENEWIHGEWCDTLVYARLARDWTCPGGAA